MMILISLNRKFSRAIKRSVARYNRVTFGVPRLFLDLLGFPKGFGPKFPVPVIFLQIPETDSRFPPIRVSASCAAPRRPDSPPNGPFPTPEPPSTELTGCLDCEHLRGRLTLRVYCQISCEIRRRRIVLFPSLRVDFSPTISWRFTKTPDHNSREVPRAVPDANVFGNPQEQLLRSSETFRHGFGRRISSEELPQFLEGCGGHVGVGGLFTDLVAVAIGEVLLVVDPPRFLSVSRKMQIHEIRDSEFAVPQPARLPTTFRMERFVVGCDALVSEEPMGKADHRVVVVSVPVEPRVVRRLLVDAKVALLPVLEFLEEFTSEHRAGRTDLVPERLLGVTVLVERPWAKVLRR